MCRVVLTITTVQSIGSKRADQLEYLTFKFRLSLSHSFFFSEWLRGVFFCLLFFFLFFFFCSGYDSVGVCVYDGSSAAADVGGCRFFLYYIHLQKFSLS